MVSLRYKMIVKSALDKFGISYGAVDLGEAEIKGDITPAQRENVKKYLSNAGLELMDDKRSVLIEKIKNVIIEMVHYADELPTVKNSAYFSEKLKLDYTYLSNIFSEVTGITIEHFIINHKIEKVKELLLYDELTLTEISYQLNYSSVAHLSTQFKKITGLTPTYFKKLKQKKRIPLEDV